MKPVKTELAYLRKEKVKDTYDMVVFGGGTEVTLKMKVGFGDGKVKRFTSTKHKKAVRMAMEHVIANTPKYDAQTDRVTLIDAIDVGF